jgi:hypothetical protein
MCLSFELKLVSNTQEYSRRSFSKIVKNGQNRNHVRKICHTSYGDLSSKNL